MKYIVIFLLVFLCGLGLLQFFNTEEETAPSISPQIETTQIDSSNLVTTLADSSALVEEDTTTYTLINGHYDLSWSHLSKVSFEDRFHDTLNAMVSYPIFHPSIKKLDGQRIQIKGYVIPFEETGDETIIILSAFPFSSCFFCGGAGPETVMDVQLKKQKRRIRFKQDATITFRGNLRLNDSDLNYLNYILDNAEVVMK